MFASLNIIFAETFRYYFKIRGIFRKKVCCGKLLPGIFLRCCGTPIQNDDDVIVFRTVAAEMKKR